MAIEDLKWANTDINFPSTGNPNKSGTIPTDLQDEGFEPFQSYDAEIFNEWMNRAYKSVEDLQAQINSLNAQVATGIEPAFPVGSLYVNFSDATNPATLLGFGSWTSVSGLALIGAGSNTDSRGENKTFTAGVTEGTYRHVLNINEIPSHAHDYDNMQGGGVNNSVSDSVAVASNVTTPTGRVTSSVGGGQPHQNMQPSLVVYMWKRTA